MSQTYQGDEWKESVATPQAHSSVAFRVGPGAKNQPLHRGKIHPKANKSYKLTRSDDYLHHNVHTEVPAPWDDERDKDRETAVGLFVAGTDTRKENGATRFIPGSHLWFVPCSSAFPLSHSVTLPLLSTQFKITSVCLGVPPARILRVKQTPSTPS